MRKQVWRARGFALEKRTCIDGNDDRESFCSGKGQGWACLFWDGCAMKQREHGLSSVSCVRSFVRAKWACRVSIRDQIGYDKFDGTGCLRIMLDKGGVRQLCGIILYMVRDEMK